MLRILLIGHGGFYNRGCEAIALTTVKIIRQHIPNSHITLCSFSADEDIEVAKRKKTNIDLIIPPRNKGAKIPSLSWMRQTFDRLVLAGNMPLHHYIQLPLYRQCDVVLSIGGDNFSDDYGIPTYFFDTIRYAKKAGAKTVIWGASIGPFKDKYKAKKWARVLNEVDLITAREDASVEYLRSLGVTRNVYGAADPAFILPAVRPKTIPIDLSESTMRVGIGLSNLITNYGITREQYIEAFSEFIDYLWHTFSAQTILIPHVTGQIEISNDLKVCEEVRSLLPRTCPVSIVTRDYDACEMKYFISQCDFFIGARTHSTIASLSTEVPTITIAYSQKAWGINRQMLDTDEYVIPIADVSRERLVNVFDKLRGSKDAIKQRLHEKLPFVHSLAMKNGEYLAKLFS